MRFPHARVAGRPGLSPTRHSPLRSKASISPRDGSADWAPGLVTASAAAAAAQAAASWSGRPSARATARAPLKASPAPTVSTASTRGAGMPREEPSSTIRQPSAPSVITRAFGPIASSRAEQRSQSIGGASSMPASFKASPRLGVMMSADGQELADLVAGEQGGGGGVEDDGHARGLAAPHGPDRRADRDLQARQQDVAGRKSESGRRSTSAGVRS